MKEISSNELKEELLRRINGGTDDGMGQYVSACCRMPVEMRWVSYNRMDFVCTGCGNTKPDIIYIE